MPPRALVLSCTLKASPAASSSEQLGQEVLEQLGTFGATGEVVRVADHGVASQLLQTSPYRAA